MRRLRFVGFNWLRMTSPHRACSSFSKFHSTSLSAFEKRKNIFKLHVNSRKSFFACAIETQPHLHFLISSHLEAEATSSSNANLLVFIFHSPSIHSFIHSLSSPSASKEKAREREKFVSIFMAFYVVLCKNRIHVGPRTNKQRSCSVSRLPRPVPHSTRKYLTQAEKRKAKKKRKTFASSCSKDSRAVLI